MGRVLALLPLTAILLIGVPALAGGGSDQTSTFRVEGMTCGLCAKSIEKALGDVDGVRSVEVDRKAERVTIVADAALTRDRLEETIESAGRYEAEFLE